MDIRASAHFTGCDPKIVGRPDRRIRRSATLYAIVLPSAPSACTAALESPVGSGILPDRHDRQEASATVSGCASDAVGLVRPDQLAYVESAPPNDALAIAVRT
jgi:hypothetical protein